MAIKKSTTALAWAFAAGLIATPAFAGDDGFYHPSYGDLAYPIVTFSGGELTNGAREGYSGIYYGFNRDLGQDGWIGRIYGSIGDYDYDYGPGQGPFGNGPGSVDGDYWTGDIMFGYLWVRNGFDFSVLVGAEYYDRESVTVDPNPNFNGRDDEDEFGFKVVADIESNDLSNSPLYFALGGSYSTAFDNYYSLARVGYSFDRFTIGPEAWALGDDSGDAQRLGGFLKLDFEIGTVATTIIGSGGYQFADDGFAGEFGEEGGYATIEFRMALGERRRGLPLK